jgi:hypothetical protein
MTTQGDPVEAMLDDERQADHAQAARRGERLARIADAVASNLHARGILTCTDDLRGALFHALADELYGNAAIDVPTLRG